ncbi:MAG: sulfite exporter TauE/SafE family protein [Saprospiraceae bacterium]
MEFSGTEYLIAFFGSFLAGIINTLSGNGSVITLSILTDVLALDAGVSNATNRVGILFQAFGTTTGFAKNKMLHFGKNWLFIIASTIGALVGVFVVLNTSNDNFLFVFKYMMIVLLILVVFNPEKWIKEHPGVLKTNVYFQGVAFFIIGFYGGFIQMGVGIFMLAVLVLFSGYTIMQANVIKTIIVLIFTTLVIIVFQSKGLINWQVGLIMAAGQILAGYWTARYVSKWKNINTWAYRLLIVVIVMAIMSQFGIISYILHFF